MQKNNFRRLPIINNEGKLVGIVTDKNILKAIINNKELLGLISISCGLIANVPFILYVRINKLSVKRLGGGDSLTRNLVLEHRQIINFHTALNLIGFFTGIFQECC